MRKLFILIILTTLFILPAQANNKLVVDANGVPMYEVDTNAPSVYVDKLGISTVERPKQRPLVEDEHSSAGLWITKTLQ